MAKILDMDPNIRKDAFDENFTKEDLLKFILSTSSSFVVDKNFDKNLLIKIIKKILY